MLNALAHDTNILGNRTSGTTPAPIHPFMRVKSDAGSFFVSMTQGRNSLYHITQFEWEMFVF